MFVGSVNGGRRVYVAPGFCPPNLLLAGAIIHELDSCQVRSRMKKGSWFCFLVVSLMVGKEIVKGGFCAVFVDTKRDLNFQSEFISACVSWRKKKKDNASVHYPGPKALESRTADH